jgi:zinc transporter ZupT
VPACAFPIIVKRYPRFPVPHHFIFLSRHFGTGVLIATAFVHLFPTAYTSLTDPCLPPFWNERYPPMAGLIAMASVFVVVGIEMFFAMRGAGHVHGSDFDRLKEDDEDEPYKDHGNGAVGSNRRSRPPPTIMLGDMNMSTANLMEGRSPSFSQGQPSPLPPTSNGAHARKSIDSQDSSDELDLDLDELTTNAGLLNGAPKRTSTSSDDIPISHQHSHHHAHGHHDLEQSSAEQLNQKALLQCLLLEAGILFHSIFIGMALSVTTGPPFAVLLVAISFHQTFEGLALGSRIAALAFPQGSLKPWLMALAYGTTTPIGQAIGLAIHRLYDPASETGLLTVGVMNAVSSGLLLFAGLVELLAEDFLSEESYRILRGKRRLQACGSVVAGAMLMALVGAWA